MRVARRSTLVLLLVGAILAVAGPAWAHGQVRPGRAAAGATIDTVLVVPSERDGHTNSRIALALPPEFTPRSCRAPVGWRCTTADKGFTWERVTGLVEATDFDLTMTVAGTSGTYVLPLAQTYDDGETRTFSGSPGARDEAPLFTVTGKSAGSPSAPASASSTVQRSASPSAAAASAQARPRSTPSASSSVAPAPSTSASAGPASSTAAPGDGGLGDLPTGRRLAPASSSGPPVALLAVALVGIVVLGALVLLVRRRPGPPA